MTDDVTQDRVTSYVPSARPSPVALAGDDIAPTLMSSKNPTKQDLTKFIAISPITRSGASAGLPVARGEKWSLTQWILGRPGKD